MQGFSLYAALEVQTGYPDHEVISPPDDSREERHFRVQPEAEVICHPCLVREST